jgi:hypothetical protein
MDTLFGEGQSGVEVVLFVIGVLGLLARRSGCCAGPPAEGWGLVTSAWPAAI